MYSSEPQSYRVWSRLRKANTGIRNGLMSLYELITINCKALDHRKMLTFVRADVCIANDGMNDRQPQYVAGYLSLFSILDY